MKITPHGPRREPPKTPQQSARPGPDAIDLLRRVCLDRGINYDGQECLKQDQVALLLGIGKRTVQRMIDEGRLDEAYRLKGRPRYRLADLVAFWEPPKAP
jgi:excisionase family DNA binding protein